MCKVVSLFAGCGGSSLGYKLAGCCVLAAVEYETHAAQVYRANHNNTQLIEGDIATLDPHKIMSELGLINGELDILDGSPPCQGFSTADKREMNDPRNQLFTHYVRFLETFHPKAFVMENVVGLTTGKMRHVFSDIIQSLRNKGYVVRARVLNTAYYGVPQARRRVIIIGIRDDLGLTPEHPNPTSTPVSFREAIKGLDDLGPILYPTGRALAIARALKQGDSGAKLHQRYQKKESDFSLVRLSMDKPSPTVCKTIRAGQAGLLHPRENRYLSIGEVKRVCSFPDDFKLHGTFEQQWGRLGNAVPPLLMKAVASTLKIQLEGAV